MVSRVDIELYIITPGVKDCKGDLLEISCPPV